MNKRGAEKETTGVTPPTTSHRVKSRVPFLTLFSFPTIIPLVSKSWSRQGKLDEGRRNTSGLIPCPKARQFPRAPLFPPANDITSLPVNTTQPPSSSNSRRNGASLFPTTGPHYGHFAAETHKPAPSSRSGVVRAVGVRGRFRELCAEASLGSRPMNRAALTDRA